MNEWKYPLCKIYKGNKWNDPVSFFFLGEQSQLQKFYFQWSKRPLSLPQYLALFLAVCQEDKQTTVLMLTSNDPQNAQKSSFVAVPKISTQKDQNCSSTLYMDNNSGTDASSCKNSEVFAWRLPNSSFKRYHHNSNIVMVLPAVSLRDIQQFVKIHSCRQKLNPLWEQVSGLS